MGVEMSKSKEITGWVLGTYAMASKFRPAAVRTKISPMLAKTARIGTMIEDITREGNQGV